MACEGEGAEVGVELVFLASVEVYFELLGVFCCAEACGAVARGEVVVVGGDDSHGVECPAAVGAPADVGLVVEVAWVVFALGVEGAEEVAHGLVAEGVGHGEFLIAYAHVGTGSEEAGAEAALEGFDFLVCYVEHA